MLFEEFPSENSHGSQYNESQKSATKDFACLFVAAECAIRVMAFVAIEKAWHSG